MNPNDAIRILVVEDDPLFQRILEKRLSSEGYQVLTASDGREGMKAIVTAEPHLVISDWMMPHVDGLELCMSVKTGLKDDAPYFVLLTAKDEVNDRLLAIKTGADDYLVKPCDPLEILARVRTGLRVVVAERRGQQAEKDLLAVRQQLDLRERELRQLASVLPSCPHCARVRTPEGQWEELSDFLTRITTEAADPEPCPECLQQRRFRVA